MIPGSVSKLAEETLASAATIYPKKDFVQLTGTTTLATIVPSVTFGQLLFVVPVDGTVATTTTDNIAINVSMPVNRVTVLVYSKTRNKWYVGAIS
jgi:hypothetical protein